MQALSKTKALELLEKTSLELESLPSGLSFDDGLLAAWDEWARTALIRTNRIFGVESEQTRRLQPAIEKLLKPIVCLTRRQESARAEVLLQSLYSEVLDFWEDEPLDKDAGALSAIEDQVERPNTQNKRVFVVHGHDHGQMQSVARFLEHLGLEPVVLHEKTSRGLTIIEKLETHGDVRFAVVLLTPDDVGTVASNLDALKPRARQNVVLELGYFLGRLGRRCTCALLVEGVEIPSDYSGVMYIPVDRNDAWRLRLAGELQAAGFDIDTNAIIMKS